jgi:hypothetical protein
MVWSSTFDLYRRLVVAETWGYIFLDDDFCTMMNREEQSPTELQITLTGEHVETTATSFPLDPTLVARLRQTCD